MSAYFESLNRRTVPVEVVPPPEPAPPAAEPTRLPVRIAPAKALPPPREYEELREKLLSAANGKPLRTIVFAGCAGREGCTRVVRDFAEMLAASGLKVLLVDADARTSDGLTASIASTGNDLTDLVEQGANPPASAWGKGQLAVVPSPVSIPDKERFFGAPQFAEWIEAQRGRYDYVLLDAPPVLAFADAILMGRRSDGLILVLRSEVTERDALVRAREQLQRANVKVIGAVLNRTRNPVPVALRPYFSME